MSVGIFQWDMNAPNAAADPQMHDVWGKRRGQMSRKWQKWENLKSTS
jgi:hypothetical protein